MISQLLSSRLWLRKLLDDLQGLSIGLTTASVAFVFLNSAGLMTGQAAGMARILSHFTGWSFGLSFSLVNLPFYLIGVRQLGLGFTVRTLVCVSILSVAITILPEVIMFEKLNQGVAAVIFGTLCGLGLLGVIRHGGSLGGVGIAALVIQKRFNIRAGYTQLGCDILIFLIAMSFLPIDALVWSLVGAVVLNVVIAWNHVPGRYNGSLT